MKVTFWPSDKTRKLFRKIISTPPESMDTRSMGDWVVEYGPKNNVRPFYGLTAARMELFEDRVVLHVYSEWYWDRVFKSWAESLGKGPLEVVIHRDYVRPSLIG